LKLYVASHGHTIWEATSVDRYVAATAICLVGEYPIDQLAGDCPTLDTYADMFDEIADRLNNAIRVTADALRTAEFR
jgi:hypothetical protein